MAQVNLLFTQQTIITLLFDLITNTIIHPVATYNLTITHQEELLRIKRVTTSSTLTLAAGKVAAKLQTEKPTERPVLSGLIQEETTRSTAGLSRRVQSAFDQINQNKKQLKMLITARHNDRKSTKKSQGSNIARSRSTVPNDGGSVAVATLPTGITPSLPLTSTALPTPRYTPPSTLRFTPPSTQQPKLSRQQNYFHTAVNSAVNARKRKHTKMNSSSTSMRNDDTSTRN
jgi:hypothetical protein